MSGCRRCARIRKMLGSEEHAHTDADELLDLIADVLEGRASESRARSAYLRRLTDDDDDEPDDDF